MKYIYYWWYPERTVKATIENDELKKIITRGGLGGFHGSHGILHPFAVNGMPGNHGNIGEHGNPGKKNFNSGDRGHNGINGMKGPHGKSGKSGLPGLPSNSLIPFIRKNTSADIEKSSVLLEHIFTYNEVAHKLTCSFLFEDISYFSFENGEKNIKYAIKVNSDPEYKEISSIGGHAKKIYSTLRVIIEKKDSSSDGTIFYVSAPINKNAYLISSSINLNDSIMLSSKLDEVVISRNKEFGLDFDIEPSLNNQVFYNFLLGGLLRYRCIFNIDPPIANFVPRIEERFSNNHIEDFVVPSVKVTAKGNLIKIKKDSNIYLLSPRLDKGRVIYKDSSDVKNLWTIQSFNTIHDSIESTYPKIIKAFDLLEEDINSFNNELKKAKSIKVIDKYSGEGYTEIYSNLCFSMKNNPPKLSQYDDGLKNREYNFEIKQKECDNYNDNTVIPAQLRLQSSLQKLKNEQFNFNIAKDKYDNDPIIQSLKAEIIILENESRYSEILDKKNEINDISGFYTAQSNLEQAQALYENLADAYRNARSHLAGLYEVLTHHYSLPLDFVLAEKEINGLNETEHFSTKMEFNNLSIIYSNKPSNLSFPHILEGSKLYMKFIVRINKKNFQDLKYDVYSGDPVGSVITDWYKTTVERSDSLIITTKYPFFYNYPYQHTFNQNKTTFNIDPFDGFPISYKEGYIYYPVVISFKNDVEFNKIFGRRIMLNFSDSIMHFESHFGDPSIFFEQGIERMSNQNKTDDAFEGDNTEYKFPSDNIIGFDFRFSANKFDIEGDMIKVGYCTKINQNEIIKSQRVIGLKQSNGNYIVDIPSFGY